MARGARNDDEQEDVKGKGKAGGTISLDDEDAIDAGLFGSGPFTITESIFTEFDYGGNMRKPPLVWLVTFERGEGKKKESTEQPYGIGSGWSVGKDGRLIGQKAQTGLPKTCNAIVHLIKPLKDALKKAGIDASPLADGDPTVLEGMTGEIERVDQQERTWKGDRNRDRARNSDRDRNGSRDNDDNNGRTILEIVSVESAPWEANEKGSRKKKSEDDEEEQPKRTARGKTNGKPEPDDDEQEEDEDRDPLFESAVEAVIEAVEKSKGAIKVGDDLEEALEKVLKGNKKAGGIIDLATSKAFLKEEKGWSYDGKTVDEA